MARIWAVGCFLVFRMGLEFFETLMANEAVGAQGGSRNSSRPTWNLDILDRAECEDP